MRPLGSLRARFIVGSVLWTLGLLAISHMLFVALVEYLPNMLAIRHWVVLSVVALAFMLGGLSQVRRGLSPINQLRARLASVREGRAPRIEGDYPTEVQPLVADLNALLDHREDAVRRAQSKAGDLAHGLKTPLAVLSRDAAQAEQAGLAELAAGIRHEVERMRRQIDYHLAQARAAASAAAPGARCTLTASLHPLVRALSRLHVDRGVAVHLHVAEHTAVAVERQDLDEMLGNLLDNACTWARTRVDVRATVTGGHVTILIEDDGPGLSESLWEKVLSRGVRADEEGPGSGLGLAIVRDLAGVYGGSIEVGRAAGGGFQATLQLPAG
jgi:signal transduction histidine kinase